MKFKKDGITFKAGKGFAKAKKDGKLLWRLHGVFIIRKPTQEAVLLLHRLCMEAGIGRCWAEAND